MRKRSVAVLLMLAMLMTAVYGCGKSGGSEVAGTNAGSDSENISGNLGYTQSGDYETENGTVNGVDYGGNY